MASRIAPPIAPRAKPPANCQQSEAPAHSRAVRGCNGLVLGGAYAISVRERTLLIAFVFLSTATMGFLQPFVPLYLQSAGLEKNQIGWVLGLGSGLGLLMQPVWGRISDHLDSRRPFIALGAVGAGIAYLSYRQVSSPLMFLLVTALGVNGTMYLNGVGGVLVGRLVSRAQGGAGYASYRVWGSVGYIVVTLSTGLLLNPQGTRLDRTSLDRLFSIGPWMFFAIAVLAAFLPDPKRAIPSSGPREKAPLPENLKWFLASYFLYVFALYGASNFLSLYMKSVGGTPIWITAMFAGGVVCEVLVMRVSGSISDRYGRRPLLALTYLLLPVRLALYVIAASPPGVVAVQILHGLNFGVMGAIAIALVNDLATDSTRGQAQARLAIIAGLASTVAPIAFGWISQVIGLKSMFLAASLVAVGAFLVFLLKVNETHPAGKSMAERLGNPWFTWLDNPPQVRSFGALIGGAADPQHPTKKNDHE